MIGLSAPDRRHELDYLAGFWRWVELLAADDYMGRSRRCIGLGGTSWTPEELKERVTTFFGGDAPWSVVVPNERLVGVINDASEFEPRNREGVGWFMAQVPLTTAPEDPEDDEIPLMGLAASFLLRRTPRRIRSGIRNLPYMTRGRTRS